jgi:hypothetical protein
LFLLCCPQGITELQDPHSEDVEERERGPRALAEHLLCQTAFLANTDSAWEQLQIQMFPQESLQGVKRLLVSLIPDSAEEAWSCHHMCCQEAWSLGGLQPSAPEAVSGPSSLLQHLMWSGCFSEGQRQVGSRPATPPFSHLEPRTTHTTKPLVQETV